MEFKIKTEEIRKLMEIDAPEFPKYATQILNLANQNAQATRPKVVGQMSELIKEFSGKTLEEWEEWYLEHYPDAIEKATKKVLEMVDNFRKVINQIDESMVRKWIRDLVIVKTFVGLRFQEAILRKVADKFSLDYRLSTPEEESKGIDGYIGSVPVSLKPKSYQAKEMLPEEIKIDIIYYEKQKDGLKITIPPALEKKLKIQRNNEA
ncbi:MjaI restriction endonuclease [Balnearium lithotrophicum]|uniref:MjaI restriction endonuclease n=1 Tax=Balnearium lithotrophicum TaxID=223788 RepID=A0A521CVH9_9BACT|nr:MjaI family restriction endonuclease [Balnearium lithotrophicum]SMO63425.1 MjaI restriction endonuclease [Balnearium lithotrophicum]